MSEIPQGCTHVQLANPLSYDQRPTFLKWDKWYYSEDKPGNVNCWYIWHHYRYHQDWARDLTYQKPRDKSLFVTIEEFRNLVKI